MKRLRQFEKELADLHRDVGAAPAQEAWEPQAIGARDDAACQNARVISMPAPAYPQRARSSHVEGVVEVRFTINEDGSVGSVEALRGPTSLAEAAVEAVKTWQFVPKRCSGKNVRSVERARFPFKLRDATR
jgi:protein TonB